MAVKRINLALQGGGAHGAFTWGVLDRLLEEPELEIAGISGTSAGALNGAALKAGLLRGGRTGARANLDWLWEQIGSVMPGSELERWLRATTPAPEVVSKGLEYSPLYQAFDSIVQATSPYATGPFYLHPLSRIVKKLSYEHVCHTDGPAFFVGATNVRTGKIRVFSDGEITPEALLASACLPTIYRAVEIDDPRSGRREAYWDGGYTGNPPLWPLFVPELPRDIVVVSINPLEREEIPRTARDIENRINEISFNSSLMSELRAINFVRELIDAGKVDASEMKHVLIHMISDNVLMTKLSVATKTVPVPSVLASLRAAGRIAAEGFLETCLCDIGVCDSTNPAALYS